MSKRDRLQAGEFRFLRNNVAYADNGIDGLLHYMPIPQAVYQAQVVSGTFSIGFRYDGSEFRTPYKVLCDADGQAVVLIRFRLPADFGSFPAASLAVLTQRNTGTQTAGMTFSQDGVADATVDGFDVTPSTDGVWEAFTTAPTSIYTRGDWVSLVWTIDAVAGEYIELADVSLAYLSGVGNV